MAKPLAIALYQNSPMFSEKYADVKDPTQLPNGSGYALLRQGIEMIIDMIAKCTPNIIICGHVKDAALNEGASNNVRTLDLTGKFQESCLQNQMLLDLFIEMKIQIYVFNLVQMEKF